MSKLLVVVDYQHDFVEGALGFPKAKTLEDGIYNKVNEYIANGDKVVFTYDTHDENYLETREGKNLPIPHCIFRTKGHKLYGKLKEFVREKDTEHIYKKSFGISPYDIHHIIRKLNPNIDTIEIIGIVTNMCVISNAVMFQSEYINSEIIVDASLCAGFNEDLHEKALDVLESIHINVINRGGK